MNQVHVDLGSCAGLGRALADGRFAEDPLHWRPHVEACATCRASVEGYVELRERIERARGKTPGAPGVTHDPQAVVAHAMARYRVLRARRRSLVGASALLALGLGVATLWGGSPSASPAQEPLALAMDLHWTVFPQDGSPPRLSLLRDDAGQRARFEAALDHGSAAVRRIALSALTSSGILVDRSRLEEVLGTWNEDLETSLSLAAAPGADHGRLVAEALANGWDQTLQAALSTAKNLAVQGGKPVAATLVLPHLGSRDAGVQLRALGALAVDPGYVPGEELENLLESALQPREVREEAARCLEQRLGDEGVRRVVSALERMADPEAIEVGVAPALMSRPSGLAWARRRVWNAGVPIATTLAYAQGLLGRGERVPKEDIVRRVLAEPTALLVEGLAECCRRADWTDQRETLQGLWMADHASWRMHPQGDAGEFVARVLLAWDEAAATPSRLNLALDICARMGQHASAWVRRWLARVATHEDHGIASRAKTLRGGLGGG